MFSTKVQAYVQSVWVLTEEVTSELFLQGRVREPRSRVEKGHCK